MVSGDLGVFMAKGQDCAFHGEKTESACRMVCGQLSGKADYGMVFRGISRNAPGIWVSTLQFALWLIVRWLDEIEIHG
jgi:hypothetical protein